MNKSCIDLQATSIKSDFVAVILSNTFIACFEILSITLIGLGLAILAKLLFIAFSVSSPSPLPNDHELVNPFINCSLVYEPEYCSPLGSFTK